MARSLALELVAGRYAVCRLEPGAPVPAWAGAAPTEAAAGAPGGSAGAAPFVSVTRTAAELSVVCAEEAVPAGVRCEAGWRCLRVRGPLGFGLTGILASLAGPLASSGVSIFVVSTYDTDYLMLQQRDLERGVFALERAGHTVDRGGHTVER